MSVISIVTSAMELVKDIIDMLPDYNQTKREKYYELRKKLQEELRKEDHEKVDGRIDDLYDELRLFLDSFREEIKTPGLQVKDV